MDIFYLSSSSSGFGRVYCFFLLVFGPPPAVLRNSWWAWFGFCCVPGKLLYSHQLPGFSVSMLSNADIGGTGQDCCPSYSLWPSVSFIASVKCAQEAGGCVRSQRGFSTSEDWRSTRNSQSGSALYFLPLVTHIPAPLRFLLPLYLPFLPGPSRISD